MTTPSTHRLAAVAAGLALCLGCLGSPSPLATQGRLDLTRHDLETEPVRLDGEWEFYWEQLLTPDDFRAGPPRRAPGFLRLPASWSGVELDGARLPGTGHATFRLRLLPEPGEHELALRMFDLASSWRLWGNGKLLGESGVVGTSAGDEVLGSSVELISLHNAGEPVELVLQVSNYHRGAGGVGAPILLGSEERLRAEQTRQWAVALFFVGILLVMGLYHLVLFAFRRASVAPLAFGLYCLLWMGSHYTSSASAWAIRVHLPSLPSLALEQVNIGCFLVSLPVGLWFFVSLYPREFSKRLLLVAQVVAAALVLLVAAVPAWTFTVLPPLYYGWAFLLILYCLARLILARRRGRSGAGFLLAGFVALGLIAANDMLYDLQLIHSVYLIHVGMVLYVLFQALALAQQFSESFAAVESLSAQLEATNLAQQQEMAERARLENEIVSVSEDEQRRLSHDLHDGLCQLLTGARLQCSALEARMAESGAKPREVDQISALLEEAVGDAYDLARGLWPIDHPPHATSSFLEDFTRRHASSSGIEIEFRQSFACPNCTCDHLTQLSRIGQEAIVNAVKHSKAHRIEVELACVSGGGQCCLTVRDDGVGRSAAAASSHGGLGLRIMAHRAKLIEGSLSITDADGGGTVVVCKTPCHRIAQGPQAETAHDASGVRGKA